MESREDSKKMAATLEGLMGAHANLQSSTEGLQLELGRKDALVSQLEKERYFHKSMVSCQKGPTRHAYAWQIGPFWQNTLEILFEISKKESINIYIIWE